MFVNWRSTAKPIGAKDKVNSFQNRRFAGIVISDQDDMIRQQQISRLYPSEIPYFQSTDFHEYLECQPRRSLRVANASLLMVYR